jgi:hypothetical protein
MDGVTEVFYTIVNNCNERPIVMLYNERGMHSFH